MFTFIKSYFIKNQVNLFTLYYNESKTSVEIKSRYLNHSNKLFSIKYIVNNNKSQKDNSDMKNNSNISYNTNVNNINDIKDNKKMYKLSDVNNEVTI